MAEQSLRPRLAAILAADVAGYTRLMEHDTDGTVAAWRAARDQVIEPLVAAHAGRLVKFTGDGFLAEFSAVQDAVRCALAVREGLAASPLAFRMGINLGDIVDDGRDIHGEGVNVAARLESLAEPRGICISGEVHAMVRNRVPYHFEDLGEHSVKHVTHPVRVVAIRPQGAVQAALQGADVAGPAATAEPRRGEDVRPSIAVLPFDNMSVDPEQAYFADGIVEDIITALSRARWLTVIARNSSFTYKGRAVDVKQVGVELGVRYVLEGSVRKAGARLRITAQLIDAHSGAHLWAERFDGQLDDVFDLQDQVTASVVGTVAPRLEQAEIERARRKPTASLDAYDYYLRGMAAFHQYSRVGNEEALSLFQRSIDLDPGYAPALGMATRCHGQRRGFGWAGGGDASDPAVVRQMARHAADVGRDDAVVLAAAGFALVAFGEVADGAALLERAVVLDPNLAWAWHTSGFACALLGVGGAVVIERATRAMRLSPQDPQFFAMRTVIALGHFLDGRDAEALACATAALRERPNFALAAGVTAASAAGCAEPAQAQAAMASLRSNSPQLRLSNLHEWLAFQNPAHRQRWADALRRAGLPD